jgi:hypothetical protein
MANTSTFSPRVIGVWYAGRWVSGAPAAGLNAVLSCPTKIRCRILGPGQYWIGRQRPGVPCRVSAAAVREIRTCGVPAIRGVIVCRSATWPDKGR